MALSLQDGGSKPDAYTPREISAAVSDLQVGPWVSSLLAEVLGEFYFSDGDFMGKKGDVVSITDLVQAMAYYATTVGYSPRWEECASPTFEDFERRPGVFRTMTKRVENWSTLAGSKKVIAARRVVRVRVSAKAAEVCGKPSALGVFSGDADDVKVIFRDVTNDPKGAIHGLHRLGRHPESDPRYYVHMVYRYYVNDFHRQLADRHKVLRFPSLQRVMDIRDPVGCAGSTPPEFRAFLRNAGPYAVTVETLPVPSKSRANEIVYGYRFESAVAWVPVMRATIASMFAELNSLGSQRFRCIYPKYLLVQGEGGCEKGNRAVTDALARSIEMKDLESTLDELQEAPQKTTRLLDQVIAISPRVADVLPRYNNHPFSTEGEQLRERIGFLLQELVRGAFRRVASRLPSFCDDMYSALGISYVTMGVFIEFCTTKNSMVYQRREEEVWRGFVIDIKKICWILHAWRRKQEVEDFKREHKSIDGYLSSVLHQLAETRS